MDENKDMIDEDVDIDTYVDEEDDTDIDDTDEVGDSEDADDSGSDDDFEYDENGDIIIPDDEDDGTADGDDDNDDGNNGGDPPADDTPPADEKDKKIADLEKQLADVKKYGAAALKKLGVSDSDVTAGFIKLAADAEGVTPEEYRKTLEAEATQQTVAQLRQAEIEKADLMALQALYPETKKYASISEIPNFKRFGELRDAGLTPKEAYSAANPDGIREGVAKSVKQQSLSGTKDHLKSSVPKGTKDNSVKMSRAELDEWRDMFPGKSDKEIFELYRVSSK